MNDIAKPLPTPPAAEVRKSRSNSPRKTQRISPSPKKNLNSEENISDSKGRKKKEQDNTDDEEFEFFHQFSREKVKGVIHAITAELKEKGPGVEFLMIPFRPEQTNDKLLTLLNQLFPLGNGQPVNEKKQLRIISKTDVWTLFQCLKYIWCRLPNSEIIGWKSYMEFKLREKDKEFPRKSFLEIMPQCLASPNHASIVYDFFDLIISISSNSRINKMSARKISKMCAIWAFSEQRPNSGVQDYDFESGAIKSTAPNNSIQDGLDQWIPGSDAMFHLLLAFLRSFVPQDLESAKLPRTLKSLLFNNQYPPRKSTAYASETILTIPLVTLKTDTFSRKPWQLLERCSDLLDFNDHDAFEAREDYALLKSLFRKKNTVEAISRKMSQESRRLMKAMSTKHSTFQAGWAPRKCIENISHLQEFIEVKRLDIDDYFIWTWLSSLSFEQTSEKKKIFGRSIILEFEFDGFKKWVVFQECDITLEYNKKDQFKKRASVQLPSAGKEQPPEDSEMENQSVSKSPIVSQTYKKFQAEVPQQSVSQKDTTLNNQAYHTVISKDALAKNKHNVNLHSIEHKISKWNPLNNLRKKGGSNCSSSSSFESKSKEIPVNEENHTGRNNKSKKAERVLSDFSTLNPAEYQLPVIETDASDYKIDIPELMNERDNDEDEKAPAVLTSNKLSNSPKNITDSTMDELNGMVEKMIINEPEGIKISITEAETFESLTKFDQYKPTNITDDDLQSTHSSAIHSLKLSTNTNDSCADSSKFIADRKLVEPLKISQESHINDDSSSYYSPNINNVPASRMPSQPVYPNFDSKKTLTNESRLNELQGAVRPSKQPNSNSLERETKNIVSPVHQKYYQNGRTDGMSPVSAPIPSSSYSPVKSPQYSTNSAGFKQNTLNVPVGSKEPTHLSINQTSMEYQDQHNYLPRLQKQRPFQNNAMPQELKSRNPQTGPLPLPQNMLPAKQGIMNTPPSGPSYHQMERMNLNSQYPATNHKLKQSPHHMNVVNAYGGRAGNAMVLDGKWGSHSPQMLSNGGKPNHYQQQHVDKYIAQAQPAIPAEYYNGPPPVRAHQMVSHMMPSQEPIHYTARANRRSFPQGMQQNSYAVPVQPMRAPNNEFYVPQAPQGNKLHGNINKRQERRKLYDNIRSGNFGI